MAQRPTKAASNVYCQARMRAAEYNDAFKSREGAAPAIGCDKDTLAKYELGILRAPCDVVVMMADAYHAPELLTRYCAEECPIGIGRVEPVQDRSLELATLRVINSTKSIREANESLMRIVEDGVITAEERPLLKEIIQSYERAEQSINELKLWAQKNNVL